MDDDEEEQQREQEEREDNILSKTNLQSPFRKFDKSPKVLVNASASVKLNKELKLQQQANCKLDSNRFKYKLTYAPDKEFKSVLKLNDDKSYGGSFTLKKEYLQSKWKLFGEISSQGKKELEINWKHNFLNSPFKLQLTNKIRADRDYEQTTDLKMVYQFKVWDTSSFVRYKLISQIKLKTKDFQNPELYLDNKIGLGWSTALFSELVAKRNSSWDFSRYTIQLERKQYMASLCLEKRKQSLVLARDLKPLFLGLKFERQRNSYAWEVMTKWKWSGKNELGVSFNNSRFHLQAKFSPIKNLSVKLALLNRYDRPLEWSNNNVPMSISLYLNN